MQSPNSKSEQLQEAMKRIDAANSEDPNREIFEGQEIPKELLYSQRMTAWLARLAPDASQALQLAVRAQHIRRWAIPRSSYPMDRDGYHRWRTDLARFHADQTAAILAECGYDADFVQRVASIVRKERFKTDADAQTLEDVACLVFLESYFADFVRQHEHEEEKIVGILRRTWKKMSPQGQEAALTLVMDQRSQALVQRALAGE